MIKLSIELSEIIKVKLVKLETLGAYQKHEAGEEELRDRKLKTERERERFIEAEGSVMRVRVAWKRMVRTLCNELVARLRPPRKYLSAFSSSSSSS